MLYPQQQGHLGRPCIYVLAQLLLPGCLTREQPQMGRQRIRQPCRLIQPPTENPCHALVEEKQGMSTRCQGAGAAHSVCNKDRAACIRVLGADPYSSVAV